MIVEDSRFYIGRTPTAPSASPGIVATDDLTPALGGGDVSEAVERWALLDDRSNNEILLRTPDTKLLRVDLSDDTVDLDNLTVSGSRALTTADEGDKPDSDTTGINADLIDGYDGSELVVRNEAETITGSLEFGNTGPRVKISGEAITDPSSDKAINFNGPKITFTGRIRDRTGTDHDDGATVAYGTDRDIRWTYDGTADELNVEHVAGDGTTTSLLTAAQSGVDISTLTSGGTAVVLANDNVTTLNSGSATDGQVPAANGSGGIAWRDPLRGVTVENDGTTVASEQITLDAGQALEWSGGGDSDQSVTLDFVDSAYPAYVYTTGTFTLPGDQQSETHTVTGVTNDQLAAFDVATEPAESPSWSANYALNDADIVTEWDSTNGQYDCHITVDWNGDPPGAGNDLTVEYTIFDPATSASTTEDTRVDISGPDGTGGTTTVTNPTTQTFVANENVDITVSEPTTDDARVEASATDTQIDPSSLEDGGSNELSVTNLSGDLADAQDPTSHGNTAHSTNYAAETHGHPLDDLAQSGATDGQVAKWDGTAGAWEPAVDETGSGSTSVTEVEDGSNLQSALDNNDVVRIVGTLSIASGTTITVPQTTELYGYGYAQSGAALGDAIVGSVDSGPVLSLNGGNANAYGIGVRNTSSATDSNGDPTAIGAKMRDFTQRLRFVDVGALGGGIVCDTGPNASSDPTEPKIEHCRVAGNSDFGDGAVGIDNQTHHDLKLHGCIIRGYDVSVRVSNSAAILSNNHTYPHPATDSSGNVEYSIAFDIDSSSIRMYGNRVDGGPTEACVLLGPTWNSLVNNFFESNGDQTEGPCDGVRFKSSGAATNCIIADNRFTVIGGSGGGTCIDASPVNGNLNECHVGGNTADRSAYDSLGHFHNQSGANSAGNPPDSASDFFPGQVVENTNDGALWALTSNDTWVKVSEPVVETVTGSVTLSAGGSSTITTGHPGGVDVGPIDIQEAGVDDIAVSPGTDSNGDATVRLTEQGSSVGPTVNYTIELY